MNKIEEDLNLTDFKKVIKVGMVAKAYPLDFRINPPDGVNYCFAAPGLVYDICGMDKNLLEMFKEERNLDESYARLYISPTPLYTSKEIRIDFCKDLIGFKDAQTSTMMKVLVEGMVIKNPINDTDWKIVSIPTTIIDPITANASMPSYAIVDFWCPVEVKEGAIYLPRGITGQIIRTVHKPKGITNGEKEGS